VALPRFDAAGNDKDDEDDEDDEGEEVAGSEEGPQPEKGGKEDEDGRG